jgi:SAM-dependent methyltransferase
MIRSVIRHLIARAKRVHGRLQIGEGQFNRSRPLSLEHGYDRGTPIDRYYIEAFLGANASTIRGRVLEVGDDIYSRRFGHDIEQQDVLHVHSGNPKATFVGDLAQPDTLPPSAFDCIIMTQTLQLIYDMAAAVHHLRRALKPGGAALITVPGISAIDPGEWGHSRCWSFTDIALKRLLSDAFAPDDVAVKTFGNLFAATAFLHGACVEEVDAQKLNPVDKAYPVIIAASARAH